MDLENFEKRKGEHIHWALDPRVQAHELKSLDRIQLKPEALPDFNLEDVCLETDVFGHKVTAPIFISSMTAGHEKGRAINRALVQAAQNRGWMMGVGSQRRELTDSQATDEWKGIRKEAPTALLFGNLGISQLIHTPISMVQKLVDGLQAQGLFIHLNALQECVQPEGTPQFRGFLNALENCAKNLSVPVVVKEVGCGFSADTLKRLNSTGIAAVDVSGTGGTHWGRLEGLRSPAGSASQRLSEVFKDWGFSTAQSLAQASSISADYEIWGSGGVRSGLDVAKLMVLGAKMVGVAQPFLQEAFRGENVTSQQMLVEKLMEQFELELKVTLFCLGVQKAKDLVGQKHLIVSACENEVR